jgi:cation diffusion facilitator CzcD-associated flavoprotein CzcO
VRCVVGELGDDHCPIVEVTENGNLRKSGKLREVDVIVCATGFNATFEPRFPIFGLDGYSLSENWGRIRRRRVI